MNAICFSFPEDGQVGRELARTLGVEHGVLDIHEFPDGETRVTLRGECTHREVILVCGGGEANIRALPLYFATLTARALGAVKVGLVSPYLAYMRQDTQFHAGESVSALAYGRFLSSAFDWLVTVDPHLHRLKSLDAAFSMPNKCVSAMPAVADWIAAKVANPVLVGPDLESRQWTEAVAARLDAPWTVLEKTRTGDRQVSVTLPDPTLLRGRAPVIVDDIASSGRTLVETLNALHGLTSAPLTCVVVHALFAPGAESDIRAAGVAHLVSTNTVPHATNAIDVVPLMAEAIRSLATRHATKDAEGGGSCRN
jgi:ribose-phosphate pyrophosphokinase